MEPDAAICAAFEALARADADAAYWMQQYKRCVQDVRNWVETTQIEEPETAPQYRLLQQTLQDTRSGLDYAVRSASDARQELASARQFYLAARANIPASAASSTPSMATITAESFRIRASAAPPSSLTQPVAPVQRSLSADSNIDARSSTLSLNHPGMGTEGVGRVSPLKRAGAETVYLLPAKRAKYPRAFKWDDNMMHHFPKDFTLPVCPLLTMWTYWVCGDEIAKYPPFRILIASELEDVKTKRTLSSLRFVMLEIESRVLAQGVWVNNPSPRDAADMLERVKASIAARPAAKRGELQPVEQLQWTSLGRILREQKKMRGEEEDDEEYM